MKLPVLPAIVAIALLGGLAFVERAEAQLEAQFGDAPERLECESLDCASILPGATRFEREEGRSFVTGRDEAGELVGWVFLSTEIVDIPAYSGKPLVTLIGLNPEGTITGIRIVHHSEPILLVGIPFSELETFGAFYVGKPIETRIVVGNASDEESLAVDAISGATVTALAQNRTILESARLVGSAVGVFDLAAARPGHFVESEEIWPWARLVSEGVFGRLTVSEAQMGTGESRAPFIDLHFTIADAPQVGRSLLGERTYAAIHEQLQPGEHIFVVLGNGSNSFKGSAFVRGGIFDRIRVEQNLTELMFRDTDYENLGQPRAAGAPRFKEGAVFISRGAVIDPGSPYQMVFLGSRYDGRGGFSREFHEFVAEHRLPATVYFSEASPDDEPIWVQAWRNRKTDAIALGIFLLLVLGIFGGRRWSTAKMGRLRAMHLAVMAISVGMVGAHMSAQPSVTQLLTFVDSVIHEWRFDLFASEPLIFLMWIFIALVSIVWGRGVFCGWLCPYGALTELLFELGKKVGLRAFELPERWHRRLRLLRYALLFALVPIFLWDSVLAEKLAELEPFKSTFFVPAWTRHWALFAYWLLLLIVSLFWWRPFCRYLCPLGGGLALLGSLRFAGPKRRQFCSSCTICSKVCEPKAIREDGTIDPRECLSCMACEANYRDPETCPPLIGIERLLRKGTLDAASEKKLAKLHEEVADR